MPRDLWLVFLLSILLLDSVSMAATESTDAAQVEFHKGVAHFQKQEFPAAQKAFESSVEKVAGLAYSALFNKALADFKQGQISAAAASWQKILIERPWDSATIAAQAHFNSKTAVSNVRIQSPTWIGPLNFWQATWAQTLLTGIRLCAVGLFIWWMISSYRHSNWHFLRIIGGFSYLLVIALSMALSMLGRKQPGMIIADATPYFLTPSNTEIPLGQLANGTLVELLRTEGDWFQFQAETGLSGWLPNKNLELLNPNKEL